jgi:hypothetical protein
VCGALLASVISDQDDEYCIMSDRKCVKCLVHQIISIMYFRMGVPL